MSKLRTAEGFLLLWKFCLWVLSFNTFICLIIISQATLRLSLCRQCSWNATDFWNTPYYWHGRKTMHVSSVVLTLYLSELRCTYFKSILIILAEFVRSAGVNCCCWLNMHKTDKDNGARFSAGHSRNIRLATLSTKNNGCRHVEIWSERNDVILYFDITVGINWPCSAVCRLGCRAGWPFLETKLNGG